MPHSRMSAWCECDCASPTTLKRPTIPASPSAPVGGVTQGTAAGARRSSGHQRSTVPARLTVMPRGPPIYVEHLPLVLGLLVCDVAFELDVGRKRLGFLGECRD